MIEQNLVMPEVENVMAYDKEFIMKSVEANPKVYYQKKYVDEESGQEITYVHAKK